MKLLPELPNLKYLLREAKAIKSSHRNGDTSVCEIIGHYDTSLHGLTNEQIFDTRFSILDAQRVVARQYGFSSWSRIKKFVDRSWAGQNPTDTKLRNLLLNRHREIVSLREEIQQKRGDYRSKYELYRKITLDSTTFLNSAYDRHGWPGPEVVGPSCVVPLMHAAGNAVYDAEFQHETVRLMGEGLSEGGALAYFCAQLQDRNLVLSGRPAIYGCAFGSYYDSEGECTLLVPEVEDPENLNKRRASVGLLSMEVEREHCRIEAKEHNWQLPTRRQSMDNLDQLSIEGGYRQ